jgi:hypothetical protein
MDWQDAMILNEKSTNGIYFAPCGVVMSLLERRRVFQAYP